MNHKYGYRDDQFRIADQRCADVLTPLSETLKQQCAAGSGYLLGNFLTALDLYAAVFLAIMVKPEDNKLIPLPDMLFKIYRQPCELIDKAFTTGWMSTIKEYWNSTLIPPWSIDTHNH